MELKKRSLLSTIKTEAIFLGPTRAVCDKKIRTLCLCPYHAHPHGCPNFGIHKDCPPNVRFFPKIFDERDVYIAAVSLDFKTYVERRKQIHPMWTERALKNPRHWQGYLRSVLKKFTNEQKEKLPEGYELLTNPEAMGVNLTQTCSNVGLVLEWPPERKVYKIALFAKEKNK